MQSPSPGSDRRSDRRFVLKQFGALALLLGFPAGAWGLVRKWTVLFLVVVAVLGGSLILQSCDSSSETWRPTKERNDMELAKGYSSLDVAIPSIDLESPRNTKTATFALG